VAVIYNAKGTSVSSFQIGKSGPTISASGSDLDTGTAVLTTASLIANVEADSESSVIIGESTTARGGSQDAALRLYGEQAATIYGAEYLVASSALVVSGIGGNPVTSLSYDLGTVTYNSGATVSWKDSTLTDTSSMKQFIDRFQVTIHPGDRMSVNTDVGFQVTGGGYIQVTAGGDLDVRDAGSLIIRDSLDTSFVTISHDADDLNVVGTGAVDINVLDILLFKQAQLMLTSMLLLQQVSYLILHH
jgi:hypothetical protein